VTTTDRPVVLRADRLVKRFPGVVALQNVSFDLRPGEVHAICGGNGAGKSTLIKVLSGLHPAGSYEGRILLDEKPVAFHSIADAERAGIAVIYQELALVEAMTVAENIFLGDEPRRGVFVDWDKVCREARAALSCCSTIPIDPAQPVSTLGVGQKQLVEIAKALRRQSRILILDEPTAALSANEVTVLLGILGDLRQRGIACIYISHKLAEVFAIADRITVLRDGESLGTWAVGEIDRGEVIRQMVGREINDFFPRRHVSRGACRLSVRGLDVAPTAGANAWLRDVSFDVHAGEVLGIGGLLGAGRTELLMHLNGAWGHRCGGVVNLDGQPLTARSPSDAIHHGLVLVSEDRKRYGLVLEQSVEFNLSLASLPALTVGGFIDHRRQFQQSKHYVEDLRVKTPTLETIVSQLSGGNQQKVVLGKALMTKPQVVLLDEPTRGIDVGAKVEVYELINRLTAAGLAVVLASSELPELLGMCDRILMLSAGHVGGEFTREQATPEKLMAAAMGLGREKTSE